MKHRVVYTVISGNYDKLTEVKNESGIDYYIVSDSEINIPSGWKLLVISDSGYTGHLFNRYYKINPHLLFQEYDESLYIDGNITIISDINSLFDYALLDNEIALYNHPERKCVYDEAEVLKTVGYDYFYKINEQMKGYKREGFKSDALYEGNIIFRKHNTLPMTNVAASWFKELTTKVSRDQLSLTYCCFKESVSITSLGRHDARFVNTYFEYRPHNHRNSAMKYTVRFINIIARLSKFDKGIHE
ncbi:glycosyltransferase domain-containing protein [Vibrio chagasii]|uniref:glycosyltransferase domain-containing protein n=1 Tax=Vibrio chagasii TaxID=170679 RepID=UPI001EFDC4E0|nr:glycosyltransferase domain-containing protein [Vibrio chagasii]MCG9565839.1 DUF616 domain-containing protein [Vibrio chagasii]